MALEEDDLKTIDEHLSKKLGLEEGKSLADVIKDTTDKALNGYDKRLKKENEGRDTAVANLTELVKGIGDKLNAEPPEPGVDPDGKVDTSKLPAPIRQQMEQQSKALEKLQKQLEERDKKLEAEAAARQESERKAAEQTMLQTLRSVGLEQGIDPKQIDDFVDLLHHRGQVRQKEGGTGYELQFGVDKITDEPTWLPLSDGLKQLTGSDTGKKWLPAVPGQGVTPPKSGGAPAGGVEITDESIAAYGGDATAILKAAEGLQVVDQ